jgi:hypothetical protein
MTGSNARRDRTWGGSIAGSCRDAGAAFRRGREAPGAARKAYPGRRNGRRRVLAAAVGIGTVAAFTVVAAAAGTANAQPLPAGCTQSGHSVTCSYTSGQQTFTVPSGVTSLDVTAAGAAGGGRADDVGFSGRPGASVEDTASNRPAITITSPTAGSTVTSNSVTVDFAVNRSPRQIASETCSLTPSGSGDVVRADCTPTPASTAKGAASHESTTVATFTNLADGTYTFRAKAILRDGGTATARETITVNDSPPIYQVSLEGVTNSTDSNGNLTHPNVLVMPDFTDPLGFPLTVTVTSQPAYGTVTKNADGTFTYTPTADAQNNVADYDFSNTYDLAWTGPPPPTTDSFTLTAADGHGGTVSALVTVPISPYYDMNDVTDTATQIELPLLDEAPVIIYKPETFVGLAVVTVDQSLNLDTPTQFVTDPAVVAAVDGALGVPSSTPVTTIASCASDPTNTTCATPPPPLSPTAAIPPMPLANFYGEASGQTFVEDTIADCLAALGVTGAVIGEAAYVAFIAATVVLSW